MSPEPLRTSPDRVAIARYGAATGDFTPIHYDDAAAQAVGLPGVIAHGLLSLGYLGRFLTDWCDGDPSRILRTRLRFVSPVRPGEELVIEATDFGQADDRYELVVRIRREDGDVVAEGDAAVRRGGGD